MARQVPESLPSVIGMDWDVADFSKLSCRQKTLAVNSPHRGAKGPRQAMEGCYGKCRGGQRGPSGMKTRGTRPLAKIPLRPCRTKDALFEAARPTPHGETLTVR